MPHPRSPARLAGRASYSAFANHYSIPTMISAAPNIEYSNVEGGGGVATTLKINDESEAEEEKEPDANAGGSYAPSLAAGATGCAEAPNEAFRRGPTIGAEAGGGNGSIDMGRATQELLEATEERLEVWTTQLEENKNAPSL